MDDQSSVKLAVDHLMKSLPCNLQGQIVPHWDRQSLGQPDRTENVHVRHYRARLLPPRGGRRPTSFWNTEWCFYEIGAGAYAGLPAARTQVQFLMAGNNGQCGNGHYNSSVERILHRVALKRSNFEHKSILRYSYAQLRVVGSRVEPVQMAEDMLWIIQETLGEFMKLADAP